MFSLQSLTTVQIWRKGIVSRDFCHVSGLHASEFAYKRIKQQFLVAQLQYLPEVGKQTLYLPEVGKQIANPQISLVC
jgi:hypothetical protein